MLATKVHGEGDWHWYDGLRLLLQAEMLKEEFVVLERVTCNPAELAELGRAIIDALRGNYFGEELCRFAIDVARQEFPYLLREEPVYGPKGE